VSHCNLGPNGIIALLNAISNNYNLSCYLVYLNISGNDCGTYSTQAIANWLAYYTREDVTNNAQEVSLATLEMANCNLDLGVIFKVKFLILFKRYLF
jgi:hypothetical protein